MLIIEEVLPFRNVSSFSFDGAGNGFFFGSFFSSSRLPFASSMSPAPSQILLHSSKISWKSPLTSRVPTFPGGTGCPRLCILIIRPPSFSLFAQPSHQEDDFFDVPFHGNVTLLRLLRVQARWKVMWSRGPRLRVHREKSSAY